MRDRGKRRALQSLGEEVQVAKSKERDRERERAHSQQTLFHASEEDERGCFEKKHSAYREAKSSMRESITHASPGQMSHVILVRAVYSRERGNEATETLRDR